MNKLAVFSFFLCSVSLRKIKGGKALFLLITIGQMPLCPLLAVFRARVLFLRQLRLHLMQAYSKGEPLRSPSVHSF